MPKGIDYDVDIWYLATIENFTYLIEAISELQPKLKKDLFKIVFNPKKVFLKYNVNNIHYDFLPELAAFNYKDFSECYKNKEVTEIDKVKLSFISKNDLILNKKMTNREKDKIDIKNINKNSYKGFSR